MKFKVDALWGKGKVNLKETSRAVTPFGGLISFIEFMGTAGFCENVKEHMPWVLTSPNAIPLEHTLTAFIISAIVGAKRFAHTELTKMDLALHAILGISRWPGADTIRGFFHRFSQAVIEQFWRPLWRWQLGMVKLPESGFHLDLDSTIFQRSGSQQGAKKGYNPRRPGRNSHHPLIAVLAEASFVLHGWLRSGNTASASGVVDFTKEAMAQLPREFMIRSVRADSGFFSGTFLDYLEEIKLSYIIVARMTKSLKRLAAGVKEWREIDSVYSVGEFYVGLAGWSTSRRFVVIRERIQEDKDAVGRKLIDVPGYTFRVFVTNCNEAPEEIWREYNKRATIEQRIEELKNDMGADEFCTQNFWATESAFLGILFSFNLLALYQQTVAPEANYRQPATLRTTVFLCGAILGTRSREKVLHLSSAWGGIGKHKPIIDKVLQWRDSTSPKLDHDEQEDASPPGISGPILCST